MVAIKSKQNYIFKYICNAEFCLDIYNASINGALIEFCLQMHVDRKSFLREYNRTTPVF